MRVPMKAMAGLAAACALASCGTGHGSHPVAGGVGPKAGRTDAATRFGLLTAPATCTPGPCQRYNGAGATTVERRPGFPIALAITFDVTENGGADFGTITFTNEGTTFTGTSPDVRYEGTVLVIADDVTSPGPLPGTSSLEYRIDLANPTSAILTDLNNPSTPVVFPLTSFFRLPGLCQAEIP